MSIAPSDPSQAPDTPAAFLPSLSVSGKTKTKGMTAIYEQIYIWKIIYRRCQQSGDFINQVQIFHLSQIIKWVSVQWTELPHWFGSCGTFANMGRGRGGPLLFPSNFVVYGGREGRMPAHPLPFHTSWMIGLHDVVYSLYSWIISSWDHVTN